MNTAKLSCVVLLLRGGGADLEWLWWVAMVGLRPACVLLLNSYPALLPLKAKDFFGMGQVEIGSR
jgi:hypothetical protein